jgi:hypothetical protein
MNLRKPPRLADWLLRRYQVAETITGDLHEEFHSGRSRAWYWRQVLAAAGRTRTGAAKLVIIGWLAQLPIVLVLSVFHIPPHRLGAGAFAVLLLAYALYVRPSKELSRRDVFIGALAMWSGAAIAIGPISPEYLAALEMWALAFFMLFAVIRKRGRV